MGAPFLGSTSGLTPQRLRARRYLRLSHDLYVLSEDEPDLRTRCSALRLVLPDAVPCLTTAALLQRLPVDDDGVLHPARPAGAPRSRRAGVAVHRLPLDDDEVMDVGGLPVTDGPRTFVDLAARLDLEALVAVGDVVLRRWGAAAVAAAVVRRAGRPGTVVARRAVPLLDGRADSPAETRLRLRLHAAGLTGLQHGVVVRDRDGGWLAAPDLADPVARVAVQHDGAVHLTGDRRRREQDVQRDELVRQHDWQVVVTTARDVRHPHLAVGKVEDAYRRAARLSGPDVLPPHLRV